MTRQFGHARLDHAFRSLLALLMGGLFAAALTACDSSPSPTARADKAPPAATSVGGLEYRLGVGDKVKVVVLGQSDLGGELEVDAGGKIVVALIGEVAAAGRSVGQVQDEIRGKFSQGILREPKVTVQVVGYRPVTVLGQVKQAGRYPFSFGMDVRGAVAMAGGYERRGSTDSAIIFRAGQKLEAGPETPLAPGDTIEIPRKFF